MKDKSNRLLCCELAITGEHPEPDGASYLFLIFNMGEKERTISLPDHADIDWYRACDTGLTTTPVLYPEEGMYKLHPQDHYLSGARTVAILMGM
jgi:hypothetical protein